MSDRPNSPPEASPARTRPRVYFNGKFYSGGLNGVHRVADRLLRELDALASEGGPAAGWDMRLLLPTGETWAPAFSAIRHRPQAFARHQIWEQALLPLAASGGVLVNLANLAPVLHRRKLSMIHDAQFRLSPRSFSLKARWGYRLLTPLIGATSARVVTVSEYARDSLETFGIAAHARTRVIYNGGDHILDAPADNRVIARLGLRPRRFVVLFGAEAIYKNLQVVLNAFQCAALQDVTLVVVGSAGGLVLPANAVRAGRLSDPELRALYENALCLACPSRTEGFGLPPLEAMLCGCPVVAAPAGAVPEICRDAATYADMFDPAGWAGEIDRLRRDPDFWASKAGAGRERGRRFSWRAAGLALSEEIAALAR